MRPHASGGAPAAPPEVMPAPGKPEAEPESRTRLAPRYKVLLHNDDVTPAEFVVTILLRVFGLKQTAAVKVMLTAHITGLALVGVYSLEQAEFRVEQAHSLARAQRYPLTLTFEPA